MENRKIFIVQNKSIVDVLPVGEIHSRISKNKPNESVFVIDIETMHRICQMFGWYYLKMIE
jgi:hypothetical protein